jgi:3-oxoacyl-ACP reductase-like protein
LSADFVSRAAGGRQEIEEDPLAEALEAWSKAAESAPAPARAPAPAPKLPRATDPKPTTAWELAAAFAGNIETYERIDALLTSAELRRNALLREIEHRRETFASRLRAAADEIIDADYAEDPPPAEEGGVAEGDR